MTNTAESVGMPPRPFLYTIDQIATIIAVPDRNLRTSSTYIYFEGRSVGARSRHTMIARNIAPFGEKPEWRVAEKELVRWLKSKGFRMYDRVSIRD